MSSAGLVQALAVGLARTRMRTSGRNEACGGQGQGDYCGSVCKMVPLMPLTHTSLWLSPEMLSKRLRVFVSLALHIVPSIFHSVPWSPTIHRSLVPLCRHSPPRFTAGRPVLTICQPPPLF